MELTLNPSCDCWRQLAKSAPSGQAPRFRGKDMDAWRRETRGELGLATDRPVIATGHQAMLWHPGILVKYLAVQAVLDQDDAIAGANLVVDQHVGDYGRFDVPLRRADNELYQATVELFAAPEGVPMGHQPAFEPRPTPRLRGAVPSVNEGIAAIWDAVRAHDDEATAAQQMALVLSDLMAPWVQPWPQVRSSDLMSTSLARVILSDMAAEPGRCVQCYNSALEAVPEAGIGSLGMRGGRFEMPLWKLGPDRRRHTAVDEDVRSWVQGGADRPVLLPKALLLTLLVRLGMCDLFVHGTGGARYDQAMERWARSWLGLQPSPVAVATATLRLPLRRADEPYIDLAEALHSARRAFHDPDGSATRGRPGPGKRLLLDAINDAPRNSERRFRAFTRMQEELDALRTENMVVLESARRNVETAQHQARENPIADRRDWAFPLYPREMIDEMADAVRMALGVPCGETGQV